LSAEEASAANAVLAQLRAGLDDSPVLDAKLGATPTGFKDRPSLTWLYILLPEDATSDDVRAYWSALLLAGAYQDEASAQGAARLAGFSVLRLSDDGSVTDASGDSSVIDDPPSHAHTKLSDVQIRNSVNAALAHIGLVPVTTTFETPGSLAPVVVAETGDPAGFVKEHRYPAPDVFGDLGSYVGTYIEVVDTEGSPVLMSGHSPGTGQGVGWVRPDLDPGGNLLQPDTD
jgi:hypothetical protein